MNRNNQDVDIQRAKDAIKALKNGLKVEKGVVEERNRLVQHGGKQEGARQYEGRKVGIDFFQSPRGPPGDLRKRRDNHPGRQGLAGEYPGDRTKGNPWEWNCEWEEMGMPQETKAAMEAENRRVAGRGGQPGRLVYGRGIYPIVQGELIKAEAERKQKELNVNYGQVLAERCAQILQFEALRRDVFEGRVCWEKKDGRWTVKGHIEDDYLILAARKGIDLLNETPFYFDRPEGDRRPRRQHEMLSQLCRANTLRDVKAIPKPNPPYAWVEEEEKGGNYPQRTEWDLRSLLRGERRTVAMQRAEVIDRRADLSVERADDWDGDGNEDEDAMMQQEAAVMESEDGREVQVFYPAAPPAHHDAESFKDLTPMEIEVALNPPTRRIEVFHHMGKLVQPDPKQAMGNQQQVVPPALDLGQWRIGVVDAGELPTGKVVGGKSVYGDCGVLGGDGRLLGKAHPFRDGAGEEEEDGVPAFGRFKIAGNRNYGLNRNLLNPVAPLEGEVAKFVDRGDGVVQCCFRNMPVKPPNRRTYRRDDLRPVSVNNTFCLR
ncbi:hypothetical protein GUITHDRAFT_112811 [Guillardia theta CCMP2712]|uniref:Uncharacterized protein n=1 Tax=Guillardia theta (strain CCMP2712) TaxID=905079 RepID=L1IXS6_GUITC|nr:hypothetical protein GUITHDRAFT_112811 [Guillardia theta CCMP2712]EKX41078.1 hypothetical protein GUITHDRAFT_112811 [Guillardia theta CCMP2712]|eukprot:XP_005828058.1 hypothetical protein GUITHDRAFT_112811 [Guillardia theta CCMP2712]